MTIATPTSMTIAAAAPRLNRWARKDHLVDENAWNVRRKAWSLAGHREDEIEDLERYVGEDNQNAHRDRVEERDDDVLVKSPITRAVERRRLSHLMGNRS